MNPAQVLRPPDSMPSVHRHIHALIIPALLGAIAITLAAQIAIPIKPVPITLHTAAVLLCAWILGPYVGMLSAIIYLLLALAGLPVLTGWGRSPIGSFLNAHSAGYVVAFIPAAFIFGRVLLRTPRSAFLRLTLAGLLGHAIILAIGFAWLAARIGPADAISGGLLNLLPGAALKSLLVAAIICTWHHLRTLKTSPRSRTR